MTSLLSSYSSNSTKLSSNAPKPARDGRIFWGEGTKIFGFGRGLLGLTGRRGVMNLFVSQDLLISDGFSSQFSLSIFLFGVSGEHDPVLDFKVDFEPKVGFDSGKADCFFPLNSVCCLFFSQLCGYTRSIGTVLLGAGAL